MKKVLIVIILLVIPILFLTSCLGERTSRDLILIKTQDSIHGSFFLGCGTIDSEEYYSFMFYDNEGYIRRGQVVCWGTKIIESDNKPRIEFTPNNNYKEYTLSWFSQVIFYIPKGSILQSYKIE